MTSAVAETQVLGDPANAQGFKNGSGVLLTAGDVVWTGYTTNDTTAPSNSSLVSLNGRDYLTFKNILFIGSNNIVINGTTSHSINITIRDCSIIGTGNNALAYTSIADVASNWTIDRCRILMMTNSGINAIAIILTTSAGADYDTNFQVLNCVIIGGSQPINVTSTGAGGFKGGGVDVFNCTLFGCAGNGFRVQSNISTSIPCTIYNSLVEVFGGTGLNAATSGQITEDYNRIIASSARANVTAGANSIGDLSHAPMIEFGYDLVGGRQLRPFGMPMVGSPLLGRGNQAGGPTVDILNRPRPAGGESVSYAWGAYERHDTAIRETSVVDAGSNAIKITGPGDHDFLIPVDASSTTITVRVQYDTNHATTNKPQATILGGEEIGVTTETKTMTAAVDTWETLTFSAISPTAKGFITLRLISRSAAGNGIAYFDTVSY